MTRRLGWMTAACGLALALGCAGTLKAADPAAPGAAASPAAVNAEKASLTGVGAGFRALPFPDMKDLSGQARTFKDYNGKVLVLHFWASWCPYCRSEIEELQKLKQNEEWAKQGVEVLAISNDQDLAKLEQFVKDQKLPYAIVADQSQPVSVAEQYGVSSIPVTLVLTRDGRIGARLNGAGEIIENVKKVLAESPAS